MQLVHFILPSLATIALGSALLMPHRERTAPRFARFRRAPAGEARPAEHSAASALTEDVPQGALHDSTRPAEVLMPTFGQLVAGCDALTERGTNANEQQQPEPASTVDNGAMPVVAPAERDRVVPLTRRRLRKEIRSISWPAMLEPSQMSLGPAERAQLLRSLEALTPNELPQQVLLAAVAEEGGELRLLALRSLVRAPSVAGSDVFAELLVRGSDPERALAIEGLQRAGRREDLAAAFGDRVDAIAAKAVFAYVGSRRRADYDEIFERHLDRSQRDRIAALLAGALE